MGDKSIHGEKWEEFEIIKYQIKDPYTVISA